MSATTIPGYEKTFRRFVEFMADAEIEAVTPDDVRRFLLHIRSAYRLSRRTVSDSWVPLSSLWTWAAVELGIPHIIRGKVRRPGYTRQAIDPLTGDDVRKLARAALEVGQTLRNHAILLTLLDSGLRASELCALTRGDYDQERGRLHVRQGKGDKARFVVVGNRTQRAIWRHLVDVGERPAGFPLFATRTGRPMRRDSLRHMLAKMGKRAGVTNVHPHRFRHTFAISFLRNGGNLLTLQELLGHESLETVKRYARLAERDIDAARSNSPVDGWRV